MLYRIGMGKGQISLEFLIIFAIFLSLLLLFTTQFNEIKQKTEQGIQKYLIKKYALDFENTVNSLCILGEGNIRELSFSFIQETKFSYKDNVLSLSSDYANYSFTPKCGIEMGDFSLKSATIKIEKKKEKVVIKLVNS